METEIEISKLQEKLSPMFKDLVRILEQHNFCYYAVGGTLLGAVRHQGFIPWDDDIDISMPRKEYEEFIAKANDILPPYYELETIFTTDKFPYYYAKLYDTRTTVVANFTQPFPRGIYIDIFPLDGISADKKTQINNIKKMRLYLKTYRRVFTLKTCPAKLSHKIGHIILASIAKCIYTKKSIMKNIESLANQIPWDNAQYIVNYFGAWKFKEVHPKKWYEERVRLPFNDFEIWCPKEFDKILTCLYGDYMQLPPKEAQKSHHKVKYVNLDLPYEDYIKNNQF